MATTHAKIDDPIRALALAVVWRAVCETRQGNLAASSWLIHTGYGWLGAVGIQVDKDFWTDYILSGCPEQAIADQQRRPERQPDLAGVWSGRLLEVV